MIVTVNSVSLVIAGSGGAGVVTAGSLLLDAAQQHGLDLERSWMVGDTLDDVEAGHRAGCRSLLFDSGGETVWRDGPLRRPDRRCTDWEAVARHVMASRRALAA